MTTISFPGLGIDSFELSSTAFSIPIFGGVEVRWYGIIITLGIILAFTYAAFRSKAVGISFDDLTDIAIFTVIFGVIGARLYYVLTSLDKYDSLYDAIAIWEGGLAIYGGIIAGAITIFVVCKIKKLSFLTLFDCIAPGVMIAQAIGRWGNFFNGEAYGVEVAQSSPLYFLRMGLIPNIESSVNMHYFHPTFLYESLWNVTGFIIINLLYKKKKFDGQIFLMYITWYGFGRMLIEGLRTDSLYVEVFRISQVVGFVCFVVGALLLVINLVKARRTELTASTEYSSAYPRLHTSAFEARGEADESETVSENEKDESCDAEGAKASGETSQPTDKEKEGINDHPLYDDVKGRIYTLFGNNKSNSSEDKEDNSLANKADKEEGENQNG